MCLVVLVTGSPLMIEPYLGTIDALAVAWLPGTKEMLMSCLAIIPSTACCHARG
uniref:Uncharacterized protein n=1 Tax=Brassica oleracea TaxID=3712 RepID=A0A3P6GWP9_BRAOL|nr:unnamed protein product [Brassica oleracea]